MGFDRHFNEDHCYLNDATDGVGLNVEVISDNYQLIQINTMAAKPVVRYINIPEGSSFEDANNYYTKVLCLPNNEYCKDHTELFLHEDEKLVVPGDKFETHSAFIQYLNEHAKRWCFYYRCSDSHRPHTESETYTYNCVYLRNNVKYKNKGMRKRNNNMKTDCPCKIKLRRLPNETSVTVVQVCNHHDHELSLQQFYKLQHGRRLPPYVKEEVMDFLALKVDIAKISAYVEMETGFTMSRPFFYALEKTMKVRNMEREITPRRLAYLRDKIAAVNEMFGSNNEENVDDETSQEYSADSDTSKKKTRRSVKNAERLSETPPIKRRPKRSFEVIGDGDGSKKTRKAAGSANTYNNDEILQSVKNLQESVKCEIQRNPWVSDQCVPVLPDGTAIKSQCENSVEIQTVEHLQEDTHSEEQDEIATLSYTIEYLDPEDSNDQEIINSNDYTEIINEGQVNQNSIDNIAYETVVSNDNDEVQNVVQEYVDQEQIINESFEFQIDPQENQGKHGNETVNDNVDNTQDIVEELENHVEYITEDIGDNDKLVQYVEAINNENNAEEVQAATDDTSAHALLPVFDVYMKDGNVTGFVVNDNLIGGLKDGVDKEIQTSEEIMLSDKLEIENEDVNMITNSKSGDTYIKHEYVHKYNLDKYMVQPHFPQYVATLAKETSMDVLNMFTNIYNEKAMFKITTTQKGKEGNTRIWYVTDFPRLKKHKKDEAATEKLGQNLQSVIILKDKLRTAKKKYKELFAQHRKLEEVALRLVEITGDNDGYTSVRD